MKSNTTTTNTTVNTNRQEVKAMGFTSSEWKQETYDAYIVYVNFMNGKVQPKTVLQKLSPLFEKCGYKLTYTNLTAILTIKMATFGKIEGEYARKIKSISTFRNFLRGDYKDVVAAPLVYNAGKIPETKAKKSGKSTKKSSKNPTKAELEAQIAELKAKLEKTA